MLASHLAHAAAANHDGTGILCTILLFATIIALIVGLCQVLGIDFVTSRLGAAGGRFGGLVVFVILLIAYVLFC